MSSNKEFPPIKTVLVQDLIPYARNSRTHSDDQVAQIAASIREFGFLNPIIVDGDNGIIAGHGRAFAAQKFIRKMNRQFVAVTCHYDVSEWLEPDWVYDVSASTFSWGRLRRPEIKVKIERCHYSAWKLFRGHHYLTAELNHAARCYVAFINDEPAGFCAVLPFPHPKLKNVWKEHRTVVSPDYQGIGLGNRLSEHVGDLLIAEGKRFISTTSHPSMIGYRNKSKKWVLTKSPRRNAAPKTGIQRNSAATGRLTAAFEYLGERNINTTE